MQIISTLFQFITWGVTAIIVAAIVLIVLRSILNYMDGNPFSWSAVTLRRSTEPVLTPVRAMLRGFRLDPKVAPFIAVILIIVAGYMVIQVAGSVLNTLAGIIYALSSRTPGMPVAIAGYLLFGFLGLYTLAIFIRIILSFVAVGYGNPLMRFLYRITEPLLAPLRRTIPPVGMFDVSPIVAFVILWLCQAAVGGTLLRGWPTRFF
ncbi:MAG: YggT family protein [Blastocatellia bacterium]|jgi:YggT family protein|nr:YggT family protein [Blastocatellia bacterium]